MRQFLEERFGIVVATEVGVDGDAGVDGVGTGILLQVGLEAGRLDWGSSTSSSRSSSSPLVLPLQRIPWG